MPEKVHKLAAIVFTDIVGYTRQMEQNELKTMELLQKQREIIFPIVKGYQGQVIKEIGDGLLMMFSSALQAVRFAIETQKRLKDEELTIRAGIHIGDVIFEAGDVFGSAVNTAARIEPLAPSGGICISEDVCSQVRNKEDIRTTSIGRKKLKGVNKPLEVFSVAIEDELEETQLAGTGFFKTLWKRRVLQVLLIYIALAWLVRLGVNLVSEKMLWSPYLVDLTWIVLLSMIPTVVLISYFHGQGKTSGWHKAELIGLPANLLITVIVVFILFNGRDLGATTTTVTLENEQGEKIERVVPKNEFRKRIAIFFFKNNSENNELDWLQFAIPNLLDHDLSQDLFIDARTPYEFYGKLRDAGFSRGLDVPVTLMQKTAAYSHMTYFASGSFSKKNQVYEINIRLYLTENAKFLSDHHFSGEDVLKLIDEMSVKIKTEIGIQPEQIEGTKDYPISEITTDSLEALKLFTIGRNYQVFESDPQSAGEKIGEAINIDQGFALAQFEVTQIYFNNNDVKKALASVQEAMDNIYKLPERYQFITKFTYYILHQEPDKAISVLKMWIDLYPDDIIGRQLLAQRYYFKNMPEKALAEYLEIQKLDPEQYSYLMAIGEIYHNMGKLDSALYYYEMYEKKFPQDEQSHEAIGNLYLSKNNFEKARESFENALLINSKQVRLMIEISGIDERLGKFQQALEGYIESLNVCANASDSARVYAALSDHYELLGQEKKTKEYFVKSSELRDRYLNPLQANVTKVFHIDKFIVGEDMSVAFELLEKMGSQFKPPVDKINAFGYLFAWLEVENADKAEQYIPQAESLARGFGEEVLLANINYARARIHEIRGEYDQAINKYLEFYESQPLSIGVFRRIARCQRLNGQLEQAKISIDKALSSYPNRPGILYEAALISFELDNFDAGMKNLERSLNIWKNADPEFKPAKEARTKYSKLRQDQT